MLAEVQLSFKDQSKIANSCLEADLGPKAVRFETETQLAELVDTVGHIQTSIAAMYPGR